MGNRVNKRPWRCPNVPFSSAVPFSRLSLNAQCCLRCVLWTTLPLGSGDGNRGPQAPWSGICHLVAIASSTQRTWSGVIPFVLLLGFGCPSSKRRSRGIKQVSHRCVSVLDLSPRTPSWWSLNTVSGAVVRVQWGDMTTSSPCSALKESWRRFHQQKGLQIIASTDHGAPVKIWWGMKTQSSPETDGGTQALSTT